MRDEEGKEPQAADTNGNEKTESCDSGTESRRNALKSLLASGGAAGGAALGGEIWLKPMIRTVVLPAHAQTSGSTTPAVTTSSPTTTSVASTTTSPTVTETPI